MGPLENVPQRVAKFLGWNGEGGIHEAMRVLQKASPEGLVKAQASLIGKEVTRNEYLNFKSFFLKKW